MAMCSHFELGPPNHVNGDPLSCRSYHAISAAQDPLTHCKHAGPTGGGHCGSDPCVSFCALDAALCTGNLQPYDGGELACRKACATYTYLLAPTDSDLIESGPTLADEHDVLLSVSRDSFTLARSVNARVLHGRTPRGADCAVRQHSLGATGADPRLSRAVRPLLTHSPMTFTRSFRTASAACVLAFAAAPFGCSAPATSSTSSTSPDHADPPNRTGYVVQADSWHAPPCGAVLASFDGTEAYSNGEYTGTGTACSGYGAFGLEFQCVELVMRHFKTHWGLSWLGNAANLLDNAPRDAVDVFYNGDGAHPPVPGDMITWNDTAWGHVALVTAVSAEGISIMEQNVWGAGATAVLPWNGATVYGPAGWGWALPQGWAHAKANGGSVASSGGGGGGGGGSSACSSATLGHDVGDGTCVQSASDALLYVCQGGGWNRVDGCPAGSEDWGYCYATHADRWVPAMSCSLGSDGVWYQCGEHAEWLGGVGNGVGPVGGCSQYVY